MSFSNPKLTQSQAEQFAKALKEYYEKMKKNA